MAAFTPTDITYFAKPAEWRKWLATNHLTASELWVGFHKRDSGKPSITWPESVDEALCAGWIDGVRKSLGETSYVIRFTPRKPTSIWSVVNINRVNVLTETGRMRPAGLAAFAARKEHKSGIYAFEQESPGAERDRPAHFQEKQGSVGVFSGAGLVVSAATELARQQCETARNPREAIARAHRSFGGLTQDTLGDTAIR